MSKFLFALMFCVMLSGCSQQPIQSASYQDTSKPASVYDEIYYGGYLDQILTTADHKQFVLTQNQDGTEEAYFGKDTVLFFRQDNGNLVFVAGDFSKLAQVAEPYYVFHGWRAEGRMDEANKMYVLTKPLSRYNPLNLAERNETLAKFLPKSTDKNSVPMPKKRYLKQSERSYQVEDTYLMPAGKVMVPVTTTKTILIKDLTGDGDFE